MSENLSIYDNHKIPFIALVPFLLITFAITWGILSLFIFLPVQMSSVFGELTGQHPLFYLCVYAPAIAAFAIVGYFGGYRGLKGFLSRLFLWRCSAGWYVFLIIGIPLIFYAGGLMKGSLFKEPFSFASFRSFCTPLLFAAIKGPVEEFGWRGFALPILQKKLAPLWAALILGIIWGFWHLPAFFLSGTQQSEWSFLAFLLGCIAISVIATRLFNASRGSILLPAIFHFMLMNPIFPDAQPYDTYLLILFAILVVLFNRQEMLTGYDAVTEIMRYDECEEVCP